jgi:hypothetical protein
VVNASVASACRHQQVHLRTVANEKGAVCAAAGATMAAGACRSTPDNASSRFLNADLADRALLSTPAWAVPQQYVFSQQAYTCVDTHYVHVWHTLPVQCRHCLQSWSAEINLLCTETITGGESMQWPYCTPYAAFEVSRAVDQHGIFYIYTLPRKAARGEPQRACMRTAGFLRAHSVLSDLRKQVTVSPWVPTESS